MKGAIGAIVVILLAYLAVVETAQVVFMWQAMEFAQEKYAESE